MDTRLMMLIINQLVNHLVQMVNHLDIKQTVGKTPKRPAQPDPDAQENPQAQRPMPASHVKPLFYSNILVIFEDFFIYH